MALPLTELEAATRQHFMPVVTNQIFLGSPILYRIFRTAKEGQWGLALPSFDGREIVEPIEYQEAAGNAHGAYKKSTIWGAGSNEVLSGAAYPWRMYYVGIQIHNIDLEINKAGASRIFDIAAIKLRNAAQTLRKDLVTDFYGDQDDTDTDERMVGFLAMAAASGKVVGKIDKDQHSFWAGNVDTAQDPRDLTWNLLNKMYGLTKKYGANDAPTLIVGSEGVIQNYENNLTKVSDVLAPLVTVTAPPGEKVLDGGFRALSFKGVPIVGDSFCPANTCLFINEKYVNWRVLKNFDTTGWTQLRSNGKDWVQNTIFGYGALTSSCNKKFGIIENLNEA